MIVWLLNRVEIIVTNGGFAHNWKHGDKRRNCSKPAISPFVTMFSIMTNFSFCHYVFNYEQFLHMSLWFQKASASEASESVYMRKRVNYSPHKPLCVYSHVLCFCVLQHNYVLSFLTPLQQMDFWKHIDKRRNCTKRAISPFATMFSTFCPRLSIQLWRFSMFWQNTFKVVCCRCVVWGKG